MDDLGCKRPQLASQLASYGGPVRPLPAEWAHDAALGRLVRVHGHSGRSYRTTVDGFCERPDAERVAR